MTWLTRLLRFDRARRRGLGGARPGRIGLLGWAPLAGVLLVSAACAANGEEFQTAETGDTDDTATTAAPPETTTTTTADETTTTAAPTTTAPPPTTTTTGPPTTEPPTQVEVSLTVAVAAAEGEPPMREGSVVCGAQAAGTGFLAAPQAAQAACDLLQSPAVRQRLVEGPPQDMICTQIYGGPEVAAVDGEIDGQQIHAALDRTNGCAIAEWDNFAPLIGPPGS